MKENGSKNHHVATKQIQHIRINLAIWLLFENNPCYFNTTPHLHILSPWVCFFLGQRHLDMHRHAIVTDCMLAQGEFTCRVFQVHFIKTHDTWELHRWMWMEGSGWLLGKWFMGNIWINMIISMGWWLWIIEGVPSEGTLEYRPTDRNITSSSRPFRHERRRFFECFVFPCPAGTKTWRGRSACLPWP